MLLSTCIILLLPIVIAIVLSAEERKTYTLEEVAKHNNTEVGDVDVWIIIHGKVYNVSGFLDVHPGGAEILKENAGKDATTEFKDAAHTEKATNMLNQFYIGDLEGYKNQKNTVKVKAPGMSNGAKIALVSGGFLLVAGAVAGIVYYFIIHLNDNKSE